MTERDNSDPRKDRRRPKTPPKGSKAVASEPTEEMVTCFMSGQLVPRSQAVLAKLGPGQRVWILPEFLSEERDRRA